MCWEDIWVDTLSREKRSNLIKDRRALHLRQLLGTSCFYISLQFLAEVSYCQASDIGHSESIFETMDINCSETRIYATPPYELGILTPSRYTSTNILRKQGVDQILIGILLCVTRQCRDKLANFYARHNGPHRFESTRARTYHHDRSSSPISKFGSKTCFCRQSR